MRKRKVGKPARAEEVFLPLPGPAGIKFFSEVLEKVPNAADAIMPLLLREFPAFKPRWDEHVADWNDEPAGLYNDMGEFVHFVVEDLYAKGDRKETQRIFSLMEELVATKSQAVVDLIALGFFETLQCVASWQPFGQEAFKPFLGPVSQELWDEIEQIWEGKTSLAEVIRAERKQQPD